MLQRVSFSPTIAAPVQMRLPLARPPTFARERFIRALPNAEAFAAIADEVDWPGGRLALVGPEGSGKSHLAAIWAEAVGARIVRHGEAIPPSPTCPIVLEDADRRPADEAIFHLINFADTGGKLLLTARTPPRIWGTGLPDLRSRLKALRVVELGPPDDTVLIGVLAALFLERNIRPEPDVIPYLLRRIERSVAGAAEVVDRIDQVADADGREITRALARTVLDRRAEGADLFAEGCDGAAPARQDF